MDALFNIIGALSGIYLVMLVVLYFLPGTIAMCRGHDCGFMLFVLNMFFGWTCIVWFILLIWAFAGETYEQKKMAREHQALMGVLVQQSQQQQP